MDINLARTFLEIAKTGTFVGAAANLNLTQTAVSARIRMLEQQLDRTVFIRNKAGARLTPACRSGSGCVTTRSDPAVSAASHPGDPSSHA